MPMLRRLEDKLQRQLNFSAGPTGEDLIDIVIAIVDDGTIPIGVIRKVEKLGSKLQPLGFGKTESLVKSEVQIRQTWAENGVAASVAVSPVGHIDVKSTEVEPLVDRFGTRMGIANRDWAQRAGVTIIAVTRIIHPKRREPITTLERPNSVHLPAP